MSRATPQIWSLEMLAPRSLADAVARVFEDAAFPEALAVSLFETDNKQESQIRVLYAQEPAAARIKALLAPTEGAIAFTLGPLANIDWVSKSQENLRPVRAGRFFVTSQTFLAETPPGALPLIIEAGQAFGTGHHATTLGCLLALDWLAKRRSVRRALDLGCGSGVLGIAAAKLWRRKVWASDIDAIAVETARDNARLNAVGPLIRAITANGVQHPRLVSAGPYDLICANILARPLVKLAPSLARLMQPGGMLILSGLLREQEAWVRSSYGHQGLALRHRIIIDEWSTLVLMN